MEKPSLTNIVIAFMVLLVILMVPLKVLDWGFIPPDDALRHVAKVISGKDWSQVLVLRPEITMDSHPGWHALLKLARDFFNYQSGELVWFSVFFFFILFSAIPLLFLKRWEAWLLALLSVSLFDPVKIERILLGRPYILTSAVIVAVCFLWQGLLEGGKKRNLLVCFLACLIALSTWIHGTWYIYALPVAVLLIVRQYRAAFYLGLAAALGVVAGLLLTGHPLAFAVQTIRHALLAFTGYSYPKQLVSEFQPFSGDPAIVMIALLMLIWRALRGQWREGFFKNPVFVLILVSWMAGLISRRFWIDTGMAAFYAWLAMEFQDALNEWIPLFSFKRVLTTALICFAFYFICTNDYDNYWSSRKFDMHAVSFEDKQRAGWAPGEGGTVYSSSMQVFYCMFFKNPHASWRYMLGYEPGLMPREDLAVYRDIRLKNTPESFKPWIKKMLPQDRLIIFDHSNKLKDGIKQLDWFEAGWDVWIGRLPACAQ